MYENRTEGLLPWRQFVRRMRRHGWIAGVLLLFSLVIGTLGFHWFSSQEWIDAFLNAAMLLGGMGPVGEFHSSSGKIFASLYALYAGIVFLGAAAIMLAPVVHRVLHKLHLEEQRKSK
jgi:hypothetical protein